MRDVVRVVEPRPRGVAGRLRAWVRGRRVLLAASLALAEVIAIIVWRPGLALAVLAGILLLVVSVMIATRIRPGLGRDLLWIVAWANALVVFVPFLLGASLLLALLLAAALLVGLVVMAVRFRL